MERDRILHRYVNLAHSSQDVHGDRIRLPGLHRFKVAATLVLPAPGEHCDWLDLGGGMSEFADILRSKGYAATVADLSEGNIRHALDRGHGACRLDLNQGLPHFADETFDGVSMLDVIEHIVNAEHLIQEAYRVLKPGGSLVLSTPNAAWWPERVGLLLGKPCSEEGYHFRFFTASSIRQLCSAAGLVIVQERFSSPAFGLNFVLRKLLGHQGRRHVPVPRWTASLLAQTVFVLAEKPAAEGPTA